ncbi:FtsK/SpoIIIE domain-containing protein [Microbacterium sp.]|uniref:FtsK/SpoIIIE domain-containing protein n=1 Tax=Microbacterium sp. TaxID=51671 RepID=UPI002601A139|nr:FtsK/SpoIIIE domain-containing protein [Microbacterium sp.]
MATTRKPQKPPRPNLAPLGVGIAVVFTVAALFVRLPGFVVLWLGMWVAALLAAGPAFLTGKKDAAGNPTPGSEKEQRQVDRFAMWRSLRWRMLVPNGEWLLNDRDTLSSDANNPQAPFWKRILLFAGWVLVPQQFGTIAAVCVAVVAFTFPTDRLDLMGVWPGSTVLLAVLDAVAVYVVARQLEAALRRTAAPSDPKPPVTVTEARRVDRWWLGAAVAAGAGIATGFAVFVVLDLLGWAWLFWPAVLTYVFAGATVAAVVLRKMWAGRILEDWANTVEARAGWDERWTQLRRDPAPHLLSHTRVGDGAHPIVIDRFEARAPFDAGQAVKDHPKIAPTVGAGVRVSILFEENIDSSGQVVTGTKHPLRFSVVAWPVDFHVDITSPDVDPDLLSLAWRCAIADGVQDVGGVQPMLLDVQPLHDPDASTTEDGEPATAAWGFQYNPAEAMTFPMLTAHVEERLGIDMIPTETALVYGGALDSDGIRTVWADPDTPEELRRQRVEARWGQRWTDVLKQGEQAPFIEHVAYETGTLPSGDTIESQPFLLPEGQEPVKYLSASKRDALTSTLQNPGWVSVASWQHWMEGGRSGERHQGAIVVRWSPAPLPKNPARIVPARVGADMEAVRWVVEAAINDGFDAAKLARPEVIAAKALTTPRSEEHIWDVTLRLYGGVTLADVKRVAEKIRQGMGSCAWLRVTGHEEGCRVVAGANPLIGDVTFTRPAAQQDCVRLNWEQAFTDTQVVSYSTGQTPELVQVSPMPKNEKVLEHIFRIPEGSGLSMGSITGARKKLLPATGNMWMSVSAGEEANLVRVLTCTEYPLPFPAPVDWDEVYESTAIPFASATTGEPIIYDWREDPHLLVLGGTGSGKSAGSMNLINGAIIRGCDVYLADPEKFGADFRYASPWLKGMALTVFEASAMMEHVYAEVKRRKKLNGDHGVTSYTNLPEDIRPRHIVVFIDEFTSLMAVSKLAKLPQNASPDAQAKHAEAERENEARRSIGYLSARIVREARSAGVTLILAGQELKSDTLDAIPNGKSLKGNMSRLVLGKMDQWSLASALKAPNDLPDLGETIPKGRGLFESTSDSTAQAIQMWFDAPDHAASSIEHIEQVRDRLPESERIDFAEMAAETTDDGTPIHGRLIDEEDDWEIEEPVPLEPSEDDEVLPSLSLDLSELPDEPAEDDEVLPPLSLDLSAFGESGASDIDVDEEDDDEEPFDTGEIAVPVREDDAAGQYPWPDGADPVENGEDAPRVPLSAERIPDTDPTTHRPFGFDDTDEPEEDISAGETDTARPEEDTTPGPVVFTANGIDIPDAVPVTPIVETPEVVTKIVAVDRILTWLRAHPHVTDAIWVTGAARTHGRKATDAAADLGVTMRVYLPDAYRAELASPQATPEPATENVPVPHATSEPPANLGMFPTGDPTATAPALFADETTHRDGPNVF